MTTTTSTTQVASMGSSSGAPTVPNPTPCTEAHAGVDSPPPMDFGAAYDNLSTIQEQLNEKADEAMYPSPPINTPEAFSPAPSVHKYARGRGLSLIGDRLAKLKIEDRMYASSRGETDAQSSNRSVVPSVDEEVEGEADADRQEASDAGGNDGASEKFGLIPIALGSPRLNPRIEEYLSFTSKDLPATAPGSSLAEPVGGTKSSAVAAPASSTTKGEQDDKSPSNSIRSDRVTEKSNWGEELEDGFERTAKQLEQLAFDEHIADPSKSVAEYYVARLNKFLSGGNRKVPVNVEPAVQTDKSANENCENKCESCKDEQM